MMAIKRFFSSGGYRWITKHQTAKQLLNDAIQDESTSPEQNKAVKAASILRPQIPKQVGYDINSLMKQRVEQFFGQNLKTFIKTSPKFNMQHGYMYKILGTTKDQLKSKGIADEIVQKYLKSNEPNKAIYVARLAQKQGTIAKNSILKWFSEQKNIDIMRQVNRVLVKWGVPDNAYTESIINNAYKASGSVTLTSKDTINRFKKNLDKLDCEPHSRSFTIMANNFIPVLASCQDIKVNELLEVYDMIEKKDMYTYTVMFNSLAKLSNSEEAVEQVWEDFERDRRRNSRIELDSRLSRAYMRAISRNTESYLEKFLQTFDGSSIGMTSAEDESGQHRAEVSPYDFEELVKALKAQGLNNEIITMVEFVIRNNTVAIDGRILYPYFKCVKEVQNPGPEYISKFLQYIDILTERTGHNKAPLVLYADMLDLISKVKKVEEIDFKLVNSVINFGKTEAKGHKIPKPMINAYIRLYTELFSKFDVCEALDANHGINALKRILASRPNPADTQVIQLAKLIKQKGNCTASQIDWLNDIVASTRK